jgi:cytochrome c oxidase subunit III
LAARSRQLTTAGTNVVGSADEVATPIASTEKDTNTRSQAGVFFAIYYCMTGIHAIHILAGIGVLTWLLIRSVRNDFNRQYFGPVDYVGLYWHIVDLIWIYLFPLLYLIR